MPNFTDVVHFHHKFKIPKLPRPGFLGTRLTSFRVGFMYEELEEFERACEEGNLPNAFDALLDLVYVVMGTAYMMDLPWDSGWDLVHEANLRKVRVTNETESKRHSIYDVRKPDGWVSPDLEQCLQQYVEQWYGEKLPCSSCDRSVD